MTTEERALLTPGTPGTQHTGRGCKVKAKPHLDPTESEDLEIAVTISISILPAREELQLAGCFQPN